MAKRGKKRAPTKAQKPTKAKPLTPQQKAARTRKANARKVEAKRKARNTRARERRQELQYAERIAREESARAARGLDERELAIEWAERMVPIGWQFDLVEPELAAQKRLPFLIVAKMIPPSGVGYAKLFKTLRAWRDDIELEALIHPQRITGIRITYEDPAAQRGEGDSVVSHAGPWSLVVSEAAHEVDPNDEDSLASRYRDTVIKAVYVYFSADIVKGRSWIPHYQRG